MAARLRKRVHNCIRALIAKVTVEQGRIVMQPSRAAIAEKLGQASSANAPETIAISIYARIRRTGLAMRHMHDRGRTAVPEPREHLMKLLANARAWWRELMQDNIAASELARRHQVTESFVTRVVRLNFLASQIIEKILEGEHPSNLDATRLLCLHELPACWQEQTRELRLTR